MDYVVVSAVAIGVVLIGVAWIVFKKLDPLQHKNLLALLKKKGTTGRWNSGQISENFSITIIDDDHAYSFVVNTVRAHGEKHVDVTQEKLDGTVTGKAVHFYGDEAVRLIALLKLRGRTLFDAYRRLEKIKSDPKLKRIFKDND